ncbi:PQQ-binding-like beta-propeller repeat protein [Streptomyces sp. NPDC050504]|uniref:outer membrane protein assembly factor BamB family protein n=1 Tax=Streptomyces sp. NPDC050504 TaxID=3365618 RepID=UPI0037AF9750
MEPLRHDDPHQIGPYRALGRLGETASTVRYLAEGDVAAVVVSRARPELAALPAFGRRYAAEARTGELLAGGWVQPPLASRTEGAELWTATGYVPAVTIGEAIALGGPLSERAVRVLGAGIAETLSRVHATGAALQGLAADTVLLAADGPRLTAFGPLGAAASAEAREGGQLSVRLGYLTPEQVAGGRPGPASDVFVLGLLLAYAATGTTPFPDADAERIAHAEPELSEVPEALRGLVARCLAKAPDDRPGAGEVAAELALEGAAALATAGWLPERVLAAVMEQAARAERAEQTGAAEEAEGAEGAVSTAEAGPRDAVPVADAVSDSVPAADGVAVSDLEPVRDRATAALGIPRVRQEGAVESATLALTPGATRQALPLATEAPAPGAPAPLPAVAQAVPAQGAAPAPAERAAAQPVAAQPVAGRFGPATAAPPAQFGPAPTPVPTPVPASGPAPASPAAPSRRALLFGLVGGAAGLAVGGAGGALLTDGEGDGAAAADGPTGEPRPRPAAAPPAPVPGVAPAPLWHYRHSGPAGPNTVVWRDEVLLVADKAATTGVDLRTGRRLWTQSAAATAHRPVAADAAHAFVVGAAEFLWVGARDGAVKFRVPVRSALTPGATTTVQQVIAADGTTVWFAGQTLKGRNKRSYVFAYDTAARKELWRSTVDNAVGAAFPTFLAVSVRPDGIVLRQVAGTLTPVQKNRAKGRALFFHLDRASGRRTWAAYSPGIRQNVAVTGDRARGGGALYATEGGNLDAYDARGAKRGWRLATGATALGAARADGTAVYVANGAAEVFAVDAASGRRRWRQTTEAPGGGLPVVTVSASGRTVLAVDAAQVTAFGAADGRRLWKFQDAGGPGAGGAGYRALAAGGRLVVWRGPNVYALPVA